MKSDPAPPADQLNLLRQQLILAQVRIMELEDERDELEPKLAVAEKLLVETQALADAKLEESSHLTKVLADLQTQYGHQRHLQHLANEALQAAQTQLTDITARLNEADRCSQQLQQEVVGLNEQYTNLNQRLGQRGLELSAVTTLAASRLERINQLDAEMGAMKASISWRWTAWLRSLQRTLGSGKS